MCPATAAAAAATRCRQCGHPAVHHREGVRLARLLQHADRRLRAGAAAAVADDEPEELRAAARDLHAAQAQGPVGCGSWQRNLEQHKAANMNLTCGAGQADTRCFFSSVSVCWQLPEAVQPNRQEPVLACSKVQRVKGR